MNDNYELVNMLLIYRECHQSANAASQLYVALFSLRVHLSPLSFARVLQRGRDTGDLRERRGGHARSLRVLKNL